MSPFEDWKFDPGSFFSFAAFLSHFMQTHVFPFQRLADSSAILYSTINWMLKNEIKAKSMP